LNSKGHEVRETHLSDLDLVLKEAQEVPKLVVNSLKYELSTKGVEYLVSKFYGLKGWQAETLLSLPIVKLLPNGLGPDCINGCVSARHECKIFDTLFSNPFLDEFLKLSGHFGFVTFAMADLKPVGLHLGVPFLGFYNVLQMTPGTLVERLVREPKCLPDTFQVTLLLTRHPYPSQLTAPKIFVKIPQRAQAHFWPWAKGEDFNGDSFQTRSTIIGAATSFHNKLEHAVWYAETTCSFIHVENKLYFKGGYDELARRWVDVQDVLQSAQV
jgi:hypothetical protein